jgi:homospermidine synthase
MVIIDPNPEYLPETTDRISFMKIGLTPENYKDILDPILVGKDCFCVNLSVGTSSADIMIYCQSKGVLYIDTVKEEWEGFYSNKEIDLSKRSNYGLRESLLKKVRK